MENDKKVQVKYDFIGPLWFLGALFGLILLVLGISTKIYGLAVVGIFIILMPIITVWVLGKSKTK